MAVPAGIPGGADVAAGEAGGGSAAGVEAGGAAVDEGEMDSGELGDGEIGVVDAPRESAGLGANPDGVPEPVGTQPDADDETGGGVV
jgi:hypothetical protein